MLKGTSREVDYRLAKWILMNLVKEKLVTADEAECVRQELMKMYKPPMGSVEPEGGNSFG